MSPGDNQGNALVDVARKAEICPDKHASSSVMNVKAAVFNSGHACVVGEDAHF